MRVMNKARKITPIIVFFLLIIFVSSAAVLNVYAADGFRKRSDAWKRVEDSMPSTKEDTFPYDSETATITSVSMDVIYGTTRDLVTYYGEVPYAETTNDKGKRVDNFSGYYAIPGTSISASNPPVKDAKYDGYAKDSNGNTLSRYTYTHPDQYWGFNIANITAGADGKVTLDTLENVNKDQVVSLRFYAIEHCAKSSWIDFGNAFYTFAQMLANLGCMIIRLLLIVKNLTMKNILNLLGLESLSKFMTNNFVGTSENGISPFAAFCLIVCVCSLAGYGIAYFKGGQKKHSISELVLNIIIGGCIIMACLLGKVTQFGTIASDAVSKFMYTIAASLSEANGTTFSIKVTDPENENKIIQMQEMAMINKTFIDIQIGTQFDVSDVKDLNMITLGDDSNYSGAYNYLFGLSSNYGNKTVNIKENFDGNLGYYFWFANSSARYATPKNSEYPETNDLAAEQKLQSMISYMQYLHDKTSDAAIKTRLEKSIRGLANPSSGTGGLMLIALTVILILLAMCLWKYGLFVLIAKLEMFFALLGLAIAGPLMITNNDKLVKTGKQILQLFTCSFLEITVYSVLFDLVIYFTSAIIAPNRNSLFIAIFLLILLLKLSPILQAKVKALIESTERSMAPELAQSRALAKSTLGKYSNEFANWYGNKGKVVGYRDDGSAIIQKNEGNLFSRTLRQANNSLFTDGRSGHKSMRKINQEGSKARRAELASTENALKGTAKKKLDNVEHEIKERAEAAEAGIQNEFNDELNGIRQKYENNGIAGGASYVYDEDELTDEEKKILDNIQNSEAAAERLNADKHFQELSKLRLAHTDPSSSIPVCDETYTQEQEDEYKALKAQLERAIKQTNKESENLEKAIRTRLLLKVLANRGFTDVELKMVENNPENLVLILQQHAQQGKASEYEKALTEYIASLEKDVNKRSKTNGIKNKVNVNAIRDQATGQYKLNQLRAGTLVSVADETSKAEIAQAVDFITSKFNADSASTQVEALKDMKKDMSGVKGVDKADTKQLRKHRKEVIKSDMAEAKKEHDINKTGRKAVKKAASEDYGAMPTLSEQLKESIAHAEVTNNAFEQAKVQAEASVRGSSYQPMPTEKPKNSNPIAAAAAASTTSSKPANNSPKPTPVPITEKVAEAVNNNRAANANNNKEVVVSTPTLEITKPVEAKPAAKPQAAPQPARQPQAIPQEQTAPRTAPIDAKPAAPAATQRPAAPQQTTYRTEAKPTQSAPQRQVERQPERRVDNTSSARPSKPKEEKPTSGTSFFSRNKEETVDMSAINESLAETIKKNREAEAKEKPFDSSEYAKREREALDEDQARREWLDDQ